MAQAGVCCLALWGEMGLCSDAGRRGESLAGRYRSWHRALGCLNVLIMWQPGW